MKIIFQSAQWGSVEPALRPYFNKSINGGWVEKLKEKPEIEVLLHGSSSFLRLIQLRIDDVFKKDSLLQEKNK